MTVTKKDTGEPSEFNVRDYLRLSFDLVNSKLSAIDEKATKTEASVQGVIRTINQMQVLDAGHYTNCPNTINVSTLDKKIDMEVQNINKKIYKYEFMLTYWRVFAISGAVTVVALIISGFFAFQKLNDILINSEKNAKNRTSDEIHKSSIPIPDNSTSSNYFVR